MYKRFSFIILCITLVVISAIPRFINLRWDGNNRIHPDEALIVNGALKIRFFYDLNTGFHDYNGLSVYVLRAVAEVVSAVTQNKSNIETPEGITIVGRHISAIASTITVLFIFLLIRNFFPIIIAISATIIVALSPICIQLAHFYTTDSLLVLFFVCLIFSITSYLKKQSIPTIAATALFLGAAVATKNTGYFFAPIPVFAILLSRQKMRKKIIDSLLLTTGSLVIFFVFSPFSILDLSGYIERSRYLQQLISGALLFDWSMQFQHTTPFFSLQQNIWAFGPIVIIGDVGMILLAINFLKAKSKKNLILFLTCLWSIGFSVFLSFTYIKFIRYNAPLIVGFIIGFSYLMYTYRKITFLNIFFYLIVSIQIIYGLMFSNIYRFPHTTINATTWIANNIPSEAKILREDWNNIIRYDKEPLIGKNFRVNSINFYTLPDDKKIHILANKSFINTYIILDSPKVKNVMQRLDKMYPISSTWYRLIENGELGFIKVAEFKDYPHIGHFVINDERSEETFTVFDHPSVYIYAKNRLLTEKEIYYLLISEAYK